jgi:hypothetical protein
VASALSAGGREAKGSADSAEREWTRMRLSGADQKAKTISDQANFEFLEDVAGQDGRSVAVFALGRGERSDPMCNGEQGEVLGGF